MKIRLMGTRAECDAAAAALKNAFDVREVSGWHPNRGPDTVLGRLYVDAVPAEPVLTAAHPEPPSSIVRGVDALIWERGGYGGTEPSWFKVDDDGKTFGDPESWATVAGKHGPVFLDYIEEGTVHV
jgi:hypothetical protein